VSKEKFKEMSLVKRGMIVMKSSKHLTQVKQNMHLLNLYSINDFFLKYLIQY